MKRIFIAVLLVLAGMPARAGCGSSSCPIDTHALNRPSRGGFTFDFSVQYIDQNQPRIGTRDAEVGELPGAHHDEVRTLNRIATALVSYAPSDRLELSLSVPFISREHHHLASSHGHARGPAAEHNNVPESWDLRGLGDIVLQARAPVGRTNFHVLCGVKLPTGADDRVNDEGELGELPVQAGSGTADGIVGLSYEGGLLRRSGARGPMGNVTLVPYFITATYQFRGGESHGYRLGNELQVNAGGAYLLTGNLEALLQLNSRFRARDSGHDAEVTGGRYVYATPGLRWSRGRGALYALVQLPVYQDVNAIQLTSKTNYIVGVQTRF
jgi:hypothetical protein